MAPTNGARRQNRIMLVAIIVVSVYCYVLSRADVASAKPKQALKSAVDDKGSLRGSQFKRLGVHERECSIYVAPSSLKGNPGYGIFTIRDLSKGEPVLGGPDGVSIPIEAYSQNNVPKQREKRKWINLWNPYWWGRGVPDHVAYEAGPDFVDYQIGFGYLPNHHCLIASLNPRYPLEYPYDDTLVNRFESPGAGAFSYNIGREFTSTRDVKAGEELFMSYGYCRHGSGPSWTNDIFMPSEFNAAADYIWARIGPDSTKSFEFDGAGNVIVMRDEIPDNEKTHANLVKELLPENQQEVQTLRAAPLNRNTLPKYLAQWKGVMHRSTDWIKENGMCLETLVGKKSTLKDAGQGAFAQQVVKKGERVTIAPLLHVMDRAALDLYDENGETKIGEQLLINYCFANPHSTILLCPTTNAVLINHCSKRKQQCGPKGPNADYRWSKGWDPESDRWRQQSLEELREKNARGLSFEIYALRDIHPGDEVFIDYGSLWEEEWEKHVQSWRPPPRTVKDWITAKDANERAGMVLPSLRLSRGNVVDIVDHPYLMTGCVYWPTSDDNHRLYQMPNSKWRQWDADKVLQSYSDDGSRFTYSGYSNHNDGDHWPCSVLWQEDSTNWVVRIHQNPTQDEMPWKKNRLPRILTNYPRASIRYFVKPYASDQHLPGVFRQPIGMRDDIFPEQWENAN